MSPDSVALELAIAQISDRDARQLDQIWHHFDQQKIALSDRQKLDQNGFRVALISAQLPSALSEMLESKPLDVSELDEWQRQLLEQGLLKPVSPMWLHTKVQNRKGEVYPVATSDVWPNQSWIIRAEGQRSVGVGEQVQGIWTVTAFPRGDGSVRLRLVPQINHGEFRAQIGVAEDGFLFKNRQTELKLEEMGFEVTMLPGETLVIAATPDLADLGRLFFRPMAPNRVDDFREDISGEDSIVPEKEQRVLLIRLVQTQLDELFGWNAQQSE